MTRCAVVGALWIAAWIATAPAVVSAQDMAFSEEDTGAPPTPPEEGPPSEVLTTAIQLYDANNFAEAAVQFQRVIDGETREAPGNVQKAQFFLGKSLYHLEFYQSALAIFDEITQLAQGHLYFDQTLQWLAQLASQLPEPAGIIEKIGRYGIQQLDQFDTAETRDLYHHMLFLMGRYQYDQGEFEVAIELFQKVPESSSYFVRSKFFEGMTYVRMRRSRPAVQAFRAILDGFEEGNIEDDDEERMRNLAWISLARVYYAAANQASGQTSDEGEGEGDADSVAAGRLLGQAVEAWNRVETASEYWLDALFESSWAFFLAGDYSRALGNVHTIFSPYFEDSYYPEALVIKAVTFFVNCQTENTEAMIGQFHGRYDPIRTKLEETLAQFGDDNTQFFEFLKKVRAGEADLPPEIRAIVSSALSDRTVLAHLEYVRLLEEEQTRLDRASQELQASAVGARILQDIELARSFAIDQAGDLARGRYNRLVEELLELSNQIDKIEIELVNYQRGQLGQELQEQLTAERETARGDVVVDEEHQLWPFDGEYWRDELGFYRQQVTNRCGR